ncbi:MAG: NRDE family protein [Desulfobacterales bacterium]|nr:NRDE family protein [Desulfobacterales bacterium]
MCLIVIAIDAHTDYPLIIAANRDEFYSRPTAALDYWEDHPHILAGRDLQSLGTWLGVTDRGRIAAVTNYRDPSAMTPWGKSRGQLVRDFLAGDPGPESYLAEVEKQRDQYCGFNLLTGRLNQIWWYSNKNSGIVRLKAGIHGISNHLLDTPWPKVSTMKQKLAALIEASPTIEPYAVLDLLYDPRPAADEHLPDTGVDKDWERTLSPAFVVSPHYGTRCSSALILDKNNRLQFWERTFVPDPGGPKPGETRRFELQWPEIPDAI